jgi:hypothetical protein
MSDQNLTETLKELMAQMTVMQARLEHLQAQLHPADELKSGLFNSNNDLVTKLNTTRRRMLRRLAGGILAGLAVGGAVGVPEGAEAKLVVNPLATSGRVGAIILSNGSSVSGSLPGAGTFGLIASSSGPSLDLSQLGSESCGVMGLSYTGNGVTGKSTNNGASGVYGENTSGGFGVAGRSNYNASSTGVLGESTLGKAISAVSSSGYGVYADSPSGTAVAGYSSSGSGIYGSSTGGIAASGNSVNNYGVYGSSTNNHGTVGVCTTEGHAGLYAQNTHLSGAQLRLAKGTASGPLGNHFAGELYVDNVGRLWYCIADGNFSDQRNWRLVALT